ncbi:uncharacterized protein MONBRDRAFT_31257 [Monosiga brevicollis MX1]|uniref:PNPLA domain-containing protein n=1 Tax=Monosiga brevicollis TaxID=81824 RepID=A9USP3_MONBE|nr:uncharacterized protein MONBRDRAFT_31257 [Monosiga brevicollis MX1]EDQ91814.1 predicted protein [Monosiga brevicollis MX1]|eukprot:XP_001743100.1 hypothetical protein [Monosiga brevicollis MX1]
MSYECELYDYQLVRDSLEQLYKARKADDKAQMAWLLRSTLHRDLGGMGNPRLFERCYLGTKDLIEQYVEEVLYQLRYLSTENIPGLGQDEKVTLFTAIRQAFGRSALLLSGGGGLGIFHFGLLKTLHERRMLPRIISGSSVGSLVASLICVTPEEELEALLSGDSADVAPPLSDHIECSSLAFYFIHGTLADVEVLKECCRANFGDLTFQEAYDRTRRILNITINPPDAMEAPRLLNYLTAPNVVIWSAACASCALSGLFDPVEVLAKDRNGALHPWNPSGQTWSDAINVTDSRTDSSAMSIPAISCIPGSMHTDLPMDRLSELFNINHFIVCQVNPHILPFLRNAWIWNSALPRMVASEVSYRLEQLASWGLMPSSLNNLRTVLAQKYMGDITIIPDITADDYLKIISNPTPEHFQHALKVGQLATWPKMSLIENHCVIELALDDIVHRLRGCEQWTLQ